MFIITIYCYRNGYMNGVFSEKSAKSNYFFN